MKFFALFMIPFILQEKNIPLTTLVQDTTYTA
jgi:hypothetical protein